MAVVFPRAVAADTKVALFGESGQHGMDAVTVGAAALNAAKCIGNDMFPLANVGFVAELSETIQHLMRVLELHFSDKPLPEVLPLNGLVFLE
jgi:hypothetical protein